MRIVIADPLAYSVPFERALRAALPSADFVRWPDLADGAEYDLLVAWNLPKEMTALPRSLRAIFCFGAGTDQLLDDPRIPPDLPVARLRDQGQAEQLLDYAMLAAFARLLDDVAVRADQQARLWRPPDRQNRTRGSLRTAVLGLGPLGLHVARGLSTAGFPVSAWSRTARRIDGVICLHGDDGLGACVDGADVLVNLLPSMHETKGILSDRLFSRLAPGAYVVNLGRGDHLDEQALRAALDRGRLGAAWLDVFAVEPLPPEHWFWRHDRVRLTPHRAGLPTPQGAAASIAAVATALEQGHGLPDLVRSGKLVEN
ncbi:NAD(P)-dependent oxidoreductase [Mesorhizobium sp. NZP2298]|uniref:NAD(P)-dependent oxidoreductase n=1 Tax=Mesorhizobium sp. NZP2298 TaxID=2483403 RepID=UPI00155239CC|nr:NAD(P)-dependent oxidoreductase [Mesorhizobium sp. NZP2298]QKC98538.1 bifunctional glyoxylate/hydroxypyruvate reductase A [Mesorhizobium sp. NZP2298]